MSASKNQKPGWLGWGGLGQWLSGQQSPALRLGLGRGGKEPAALVLLSASLLMIQENVAHLFFLELHYTQ